MEHGDDLIVAGTTVSIYPTAATLLDRTFGTRAITPDPEVGLATSTVATA